MDPEVWGPHAWIFLHTVTLNYPNNPNIYTKEKYKNFFLNIGKILPCAHCSNNYYIHLKKYPIENYLDSKKNLVIWLIHIHNEVNKIFNKKTITYEEFIQIYKNIYQKKNNTNTLFYLFIILLIFLIIFILYNYHSYFLKLLPELNFNLHFQQSNPKSLLDYFQKHP